MVERKERKKGLERKGGNEKGDRAELNKMFTARRVKGECCCNEGTRVHNFSHHDAHAAERAERRWPVRRSLVDRGSRAQSAGSLLESLLLMYFIIGSTGLADF